ncbi:hypothetical protein [Pseudomonas entomophila]|uniref:hypothetical protein n=1 Tax=Pseudomonas entomophila TaxID=312306 RepID=UPI003EBCD376
MIDEQELEEFGKAILTGVTVGLGSQVLLFGDKLSLIVQCPYRCNRLGIESWGHGENAKTSNLIFGFLNEKVESASCDSDGVLSIFFTGEKSISIVPEKDGLESYVLSSKYGISPVLMI